MPDLSTGKYGLQLKQAIQLITPPQSLSSDGITTNAVSKASKSTKASKRKSKASGKQTEMKGLDWDPYLTAIGDRCFAFVTKDLSGSFFLRFVEMEYMTEIRSMLLSDVPTGLSFRKSHLFVFHHHSVIYFSITVSALTLCDLFKAANQNTPFSLHSHGVQVNSVVQRTDVLLENVTPGLMEGDLWQSRMEERVKEGVKQYEQVKRGYEDEDGKRQELQQQEMQGGVEKCSGKRSKRNTSVAATAANNNNNNKLMMVSSETVPKKQWMVVDAQTAAEEERALLAIDDQAAFEKAALAFVARRQRSNAGIISLDMKFLSALIGRCIRNASSSSSSSTTTTTNTVCSELLQALLSNGVDVSINSSILPALLHSNDLDTVVLFLLRVQTIKVSDLLLVLSHFIQVNPTIIQTFAVRNGWETRSAMEQKRVFLSVIGRMVVRVRCDLAELKTGMTAMTMDDVYGVCLLLTMMLAELDKEKVEEKQLYEKNMCPTGRLYANALIQWLNSMMDANLMRMVMESKSDERFSQ